MTILELCNIVKELGLSVGIFILCFYMVKMFIEKIVANLEKLVKQNEKFMDRVREEHGNMSKEHRNSQNQHDEMIKTLGRINGYSKD